METNQRVGQLTLVRPEGDKWLCICDCGSTKLVAERNLKEKRTKSCGCLRTAAHHRAMGAALRGGLHGVC
jgi:hypothetical protein